LIPKLAINTGKTNDSPNALPNLDDGVCLQLTCGAALRFLVGCAFKFVIGRGKRRASQPHVPGIA
jgi:hypothetical protein